MNTVALLHSDLPLSRRLADTIAAAPGLEVSGVADSLPALRELLGRGMPDVLLVDLMLPAAHVNGVLHDLRHGGAQDAPKLLVLAVSADDPRVMDALCHGADSYFAHAASAQSLPDSIEALLRGESAITPDIARQLKAHFEDRGIGDTDRRLLQWIAEGFLVSEVARALQWSAHSVGVRVRELYRQLQADVWSAPMPA